MYKYSFVSIKRTKMKAISITNKGRVALREAPRPESAANEHLIIQMQAMGINSGDRFFISGAFPPGFFPVSRYDIAGVSGVGKVIVVGNDVPERYLGKHVTVYRSLVFSDTLIGTWSEYAHLHYLECAILPEGVNP